MAEAAFCINPIEIDRNRTFTMDTIYSIEPFIHALGHECFQK